MTTLGDLSLGSRILNCYENRTNLQGITRPRPSNTRVFGLRAHPRNAFLDPSLHSADYLKLLYITIIRITVYSASRLKCTTNYLSPIILGLNKVCSNGREKPTEVLIFRKISNFYLFQYARARDTKSFFFFLQSNPYFCRRTRMVNFIVKLFCCVLVNGSKPVID